MKPKFFQLGDLMHWWLKLLSGEEYRRWIAIGCVIFVTGLAALGFSAALSPTAVSNSLLLHKASPRLQQSFDRPFVGELIFNSEIGQSPFSNRIDAHIAAATESIDVAAFSFQHPPLLRSLASRSDEGVSVTLTVADKRREAMVNMLREHNLHPGNVEFKYSIPEPKSYMHHKLWLFDAHTESPAVAIGSWNPTQEQEWFDPSFMLFTQDKEVAKVVTEEHKRIRQGMSGRRKNTDMDYSPFAASFTYTNGTLELWQAPGNEQENLKQRILSAIANAKESVDLVMWYFNDRDILRILHDKIAVGVRVRILVEDTTIKKTKDLQTFARRNDVEVITDASRTAQVAKHGSCPEGFNPYLHQHVAIVDEALVITGSANWTRSGFYRNDELSIVTDVPWVVDEFSCQFHALRRNLLDSQKPISR